MSEYFLLKLGAGLQAPVSSLALANQRDWE